MAIDLDGESESEAARVVDSCIETSVCETGDPPFLSFRPDWRGLQLSESAAGGAFFASNIYVDGSRLIMLYRETYQQLEAIS